MLERITAEQTELYRRVPPPGENIPVKVDPTHIDVAVRDPRYNSDHYMVMGLLRGGTARAHGKYIAEIGRASCTGLNMHLDL